MKQDFKRRVSWIEKTCIHEYVQFITGNLILIIGKQSSFN